MNFDHFKIFGNCSNSIHYQKPTFEEIYSMIINEENNHVINESVFQNEWFQELFSFLKNETLKFFTTNDLMEYFPIKSKPFKILGKNKNKNFYKLYVVNDYLSNQEIVKNILIKISSNVIDVSNEDVKLIFNDLNQGHALFTAPKIKKDFGIIWLHKNKASLNDFEHEFIHYLEWIKGFYAIKFKIDDNYFESQEMFKQMFQVSNEDIEYFLKKEEYQTLINDFLNDLKELKIKYFKNWEGLRFARYISYYVLKNDQKSNNDYLNDIQNFNYFDFLNSKHSFAFPMIVAYNCMNYKIQNIKNHIFGIFNL